VKDREIEKLQTDKKALERSINEKEKAVENLKNQTGSDVKVGSFIVKVLILKIGSYVVTRIEGVEEKT